MHARNHHLRVPRFFEFLKILGRLIFPGLRDVVARTLKRLNLIKYNLPDSSAHNQWNGKILRIDPVTGDGVSTNPFYDTGNPRSPQSRVWTLGLRNPFRMALMPNTGSHLSGDGNPGTIVLGDVGSAFHEELNVIDGPGQNFGWPLWEGHFKHWTYVYKWSPPSQLAPNPLFGINGCTKEYFDFKDLLVQLRGNLYEPFKNPCDDNQQIPNTIPTFVEKPPAISWRNKLLELPAEAFTYYFDLNNGWKTNIRPRKPCIYSGKRDKRFRNK